MSNDSYNCAPFTEPFLIPAHPNLKVLQSGNTIGKFIYCGPALARAMASHLGCVLMDVLQDFRYAAADLQNDLDRRKPGNFRALPLRAKKPMR